MPRIIIELDGEARDRASSTLSERVTSENLGDAHYAAQLIERLRWAVADAETATDRPTTLGDSRSRIPTWHIQPHQDVSRNIVSTHSR